jgi:hypothetical protein
MVPAFAAERGLEPVALSGSRSARSVDRGAGHDRAAAAVEEDARETGREELPARVVVQRGVLDGQRALVLVHDEEDPAAALAGMVAADDGALHQHVAVVAVGVDGAAAAATRRARLGRVGPEFDGPVAGHEAVEDIPVDVDAAQRAAVWAA